MKSVPYFKVRITIFRLGIGGNLYYNDYKAVWRMENTLERTELLVGNNGIHKLKKAVVMVVGVGGVGSYSAEALARAGIGTLILVDGDTIAPSNLNRQIHAVYDTIGQSKTVVMKQRIECFRNDCEVIIHDIFYKEDQNDIIFDRHVDFVIDAIDTITSKVDLITFCLEHNIPFISSMGMANRLDPTKIQYCDLMKTSYDPLAKVMRNLIRKKRLKGKVPVIYSSEQPFIQTKIINEDGKTRKEKMPPASSPFVPSAAGLACAAKAVMNILEQKEEADEV